MLTISEVAEQLRVSEITIYRYLKSGQIKGTKIGKQWRIREDIVEKIKSEGIKNEK